MNNQTSSSTAHILEAIIEVQKRKGTQPGTFTETTDDDLIRLARQGNGEGVTILAAPAGDTVSFYATSARVPGLIYPVSAEGCTCPGYIRAGRCKHYALYLQTIGASPFSAAMSDDVIAELVRFRTAYRALQHEAKAHDNKGNISRAIDTLLAELELFLIAAEAEGIDRAMLREHWRAAADAAATPAPAVNPSQTRYVSPAVNPATPADVAKAEIIKTHADRVRQEIVHHREELARFAADPAVGTYLTSYQGEYESAVDLELREVTDLAKLSVQTPKDEDDRLAQNKELAYQRHLVTKAIESRQRIFLNAAEDYDRLTRETKQSA